MTETSSRDSLIDFGWRLGSVIGGALGFFAAMDMHAGVPGSCRRHGKEAAKAITSCMTDDLVSSLKPYIICVGAGILAGALLGAITMRAVHAAGALARGSGRQRAQEPTPDTSQAASAAGRRMVAKFSSPCSTCGGQIAPGSLIEHRGRGLSVCSGCF